MRHKRESKKPHFCFDYLESIEYVIFEWNSPYRP